LGIKCNTETSEPTGPLRRTRTLTCIFIRPEKMRPKGSYFSSWVNPSTFNRFKRQSKLCTSHRCAYTAELIPFEDAARLPAERIEISGLNSLELEFVNP